MRIPHIINTNTLIEYKPSPESLDLIGEKDRKFIAENFEWNKDHCPTLVDFCVRTISKHFERNPLLHELPCVDRDHVLEVLSTDLSLKIAVTFVQVRKTALENWLLRRPVQYLSVVSNMVFEIQCLNKNLLRIYK